MSFGKIARRLAQLEDLLYGRDRSDLVVVDDFEDLEHHPEYRGQRQKSGPRLVVAIGKTMRQMQQWERERLEQEGEHLRKEIGEIGQEMLNNVKNGSPDER